MQRGGARIEAFGGGAANTMAVVAEGVERIGQVVEKYATAVQERESTAWVNESIAKLHNLGDDYLFNAESGAFTKKGKSALGLTAAGKQEMERWMEEIQGQAPNPVAAQAFRAQALSVYSGNMRALARHEASERREYDISAASARSAAAIQAVGNMYTSPAEEIEQAFEIEVAPALQQVAGMKGEDAGRKLLILEARSTPTPSTRFCRPGTTRRRKARLERWKEDIPPDKRNALAGKVHDVEVAENADAMAQDFIAQLKAGVKTEGQIEDAINAVWRPGDEKGRALCV
jgi:hypothetical protein